MPLGMDIHTQTNKHTWQHESDFMKPGARAAGAHLVQNVSSVASSLFVH